MKTKCLYIIALCTFFVYPCLFASCNDEEENDEINLASDFFSQSVWEGEFKSSSRQAKLTFFFLSDTTAKVHYGEQKEVLKYTINDKLLILKSNLFIQGQWLLINQNQNLDELEFIDRLYDDKAATIKIKKTY